MDRGRAWGRFTRSCYRARSGLDLARGPAVGLHEGFTDAPRSGVVLGANMTWTLASTLPCRRFDDDDDGDVGGHDGFGARADGGDGAGVAGEEEDISDEELARRLQDEADREAYDALYGPPPGARGASPVRCTCEVQCGPCGLSSCDHVRTCASTPAHPPRTAAAATASVESRTVNAPPAPRDPHDLRTSCAPACPWKQVLRRASRVWRLRA